VASGDRARSADRIDLPVAIRGASLGFSVLLIGILLSTVLRTTMPAVGLAGTVAAYVLAFFLAGRKTGTATVPALHGAFAATVAYALILPLILRDPAGRNIAQIALTLALAVGIGALTGWISSTPRH
jgi:hypothetical protein